MLTRFGRFSEWIRALMVGAAVVTRGIMTPRQLLRPVGDTKILHRERAEAPVEFPAGLSAVVSSATTTVPGVSSPEVSATTTVLVFSHRPEVREAITMAVGRRPAPDLPRVRYIEAGGVAEVLAAVDAGGVDLAILDGEAQPTGGMGAVAAAQERDHRLPADHRRGPAARRPLARHLVAGRRRARPPARPAGRRRDGRRRAAPLPRGRAARGLGLTAARGTRATPC